MESGRGLYASTQRRHLNFPPPEGGPQNSPGALALGKPAVPDSPWKGGRFWMKRTPFCVVMSVWANPSLTCWFIRFLYQGPPPFPPFQGASK